MAKRNKKQFKTTKKALDGNMRVVNPNVDKWCDLKPKKERMNTKAPYGYIVQVPIPKEQVCLEELTGYIISCKVCKKEGIMLLQIVKPEHTKRKYKVTNESGEVEDRVGRRKIIRPSHYLNVQRLRVSPI